MKILCLFGRYAYGDAARGEGYEHANFLPALRALGHEAVVFDTFDRGGYRDFADLNRKLIEAVVEMRPDLLFCVLMHYEVWTETLDLVRANTPVAILNWGTDDSWKFRQVSRYLAAHVDVHVTTDRGALDEARRMGLTNVMQSQWAASAARLMEPVASAECRYGVSFVGAAYGDRRRWVEALRGAGITVACFGHGWDNGPVSADEVTRIYSTSRISLNFADSGRQLEGGRVARSRQIKARTFEVPGAGGCLLTQPADGIETYFQPGREIALFDDEAALVAGVRRYLGDPAARDAMARAGHERVRREHAYEARFPALLAVALEAAARRGVRGWQLAPDIISAAAARHRVGPALALFRGLLVGACTALFGRERGARAARRFAFEISWRLFGAGTYGAAGLPGRLFYRES